MKSLFAKRLTSTLANLEKKLHSSYGQLLSADDSKSISVKSTGTFLLLDPPSHQNIRKTVEIVPEKMKKSSIEILQILVLSKYN